MECPLRMKSVPCQQCGHEIECARHVISEACPTCGALVDVAAWRPLWAVQDLEDKIRQQLDLPPDLRAQMLAKTAERRDALRRELTSVPLPGRAPTPPPLPMAARTEARPEAREAREAPEAPPPVVDYREARRLQKEEARRKRAEEEAARRAARGPTVWERLGPATMENLGFALASFLIVAGAIYFATTAWTTMSGEERLLVVTGGLVLLGGVLFAAGRLLNRGGTIPEVERVLLLVCCLLVPVAAVPAGNLLGLSLGLGVLAALLVVGPGFLTARALGKNLDPALWPFFPLAFTVLASLPLAGSMVGRAPLLSAGITAALLIASVMGYARWVVPRAAEPRATFLWPPLLLAFAALVFAGRTAIAAAALGAETGRVFATVGIVLSAVAVAVTTMEAALGKRGLFGGGRSAVLLVIAIAVSVTGTVFALGDDVGLAIAAALGAWAAIRAGLALPVPWLAIPGLVLSVIAYLKSPSPIREAVLRLRDQVAAELGYVDEPLPLAWYGLTFLPYVAACGVAGWWLLRRKRRGEATVLLTWTFLIAAGLTALSLLQGWDVTKWDLRAPAAVLGAQGALLFALGWAVRHRWLLFFGALGVYGGAACAALYVFSDPAVILLVLAVAGIVGIAVAAGSRVADGGLRSHVHARASSMPPSCWAWGWSSSHWWTSSARPPPSGGTRSRSSRSPCSTRRSASPTGAPRESCSPRSRSRAPRIAYSRPPFPRARRDCTSSCVPHSPSCRSWPGRRRGSSRLASAIRS